MKRKWIAMLSVCSAMTVAAGFATLTERIENVRADEVGSWQAVVDGGYATVTTEIGTEGALKVVLDKQGNAFAGVKASVAEQIVQAAQEYATVAGISFKINNAIELSEDNALVIKADLGEKGEWTVNKNQILSEVYPSLEFAEESEVSIDLSCVPMGASVTDITDITIGVSGEEDAEFYLSDFAIVYGESVIAQVKKEAVAVNIEEVMMRTALYTTGTDAAVNSALVTDGAKSKEESGKSIALTVTSPSGATGLGYGMYFPVAAEHNKLNLVNPKGMSFWLYNANAVTDCGVYFKFSDGDNGFACTVYDEANNVVTNDSFGLNFTGFRRYEFDFNFTQLAKPELEIGIWGGSSQIALNLSKVEFLDNVTEVAGEKDVLMNNMEITTLYWSADTAYTAEIGVVQSDEFSHETDKAAAKIVRGTSTSWGVAQIYINNFANGFVAGSGAKAPIAFSFWVYNAVALPAFDANGITIKYVDAASQEIETWNYYWEDENGNVGKTNDLNFVGWRKYTVCANATELAYPRVIVGVWGTAAAEMYLSDFAIFDDSVTETIVTNGSIELVKTDDVANFEKVETKYEAKIENVDNAVCFTVNADGALGSAYIERSLDGIFTTEDTALKLTMKADKSYDNLLVVYVMYDDGSGVEAPYLAVPTLSFIGTDEVTEVIRFDNLPYYVTPYNVKAIRIATLAAKSMTVMVTGLEAIKEEVEVNKKVYSRAVADFETAGQTDKWLVVKDVDTMISKGWERKNTKVGTGAMSFRFENMKGVFSWGQVNYDVEDIIASNQDKGVLGMSFWMYNETYVTAGELGFMIKLITTDGAEFEVPWNYIETDKGIYNGLCYDGWMRVEIPLNAKTVKECDYSGDPLAPVDFDWTKLRTICIGIWGGYYSYEEGYSCHTIIDDVRFVSEREFGGVKYSIRYELNGGTLPEDAATMYEEGKSYTLPIPTKNGYTFGGWYTDESFSTSCVTEISADQKGDVFFYAAWTKKGGASGKGCGASLGLSTVLISMSAMVVSLLKKKEQENN